jgi:hypothetical protein
MCASSFSKWLDAATITLFFSSAAAFAPDVSSDSLKFARSRKGTGLRDTSRRLDRSVQATAFDNTKVIGRN